MNVRERRQQKGWSQEQLAQLSGLSARTIQRIEQGHNPGLESLKSLAAVFGVQVADLQVSRIGTRPSMEWMQQALVSHARGCLLKYADFEGRAGRAEYWWFTLFVVLVSAAMTLIHDVLGGLSLVFFAVPFLAAGARRLHETGRSGWWQLFGLVPFGWVLVMILLMQPAPKEQLSV